MKAIRSAALLGGLLFVVVAGCAKAPRTGELTNPLSTAPDQTDSGGTPTTSNKTGDPTHAKTEYSLTAEQYLQEHVKDKAAAKAKYRGKIVELTGTVNGFAYHGRRQAIVLMETSGSPFDVQCATMDKYPWDKVVPGQMVKIRGKWEEFITCGLTDAVLVDAGKSPATSISAPDLAKAYQKDMKKTVEEHKGKYLIVEGELLEPIVDILHATLVLKGAGNTRVRCWLTLADSDRREVANAMKAGQKIRLFGKIYEDKCNDEYVALEDCFLLTDVK